jgi:hypothetical protein
MGKDAEFKTPAEGGEDPAAMLRKLLAEVEAAPIPRHLRFQLSHRLEEALERLPQLRAGVGSRGEPPANAQCACVELQRFIAVIARDQHRRSPRIPSELATAWTQAADEIAALVGCKSDDRSPERGRPGVGQLQ